MMPGATHSLIDQLTTAVSAYNSMVHGDPTAAQQSLARMGEGIAYVTDRDYASPARANSIAVETGVAVAFLIARAQVIFQLS
jgi:hypothetical protein